MRLRCWTAVLLLAAGLAGPAPGQVKLQWKFKEGEKFYLEEKTVAKQTLKFMGADKKQDLNQTRITRFTVLKKNDDNSLVLEVKIEAVKVKTGGDTMASARMLQDLEGATFKVTLSPKMRIIKFEGYDALIKKMAKTEEIGKMVRALITEDALSKPIEALFGFLPEKDGDKGEEADLELKKGDTWTALLDRPLGFMGTLKMTNSYTFQGKEEVEGKELVKLEVVNTKSTFTHSGAGGGLAFRIVKGDFKVDKKKTQGIIYFSPRLGRVVRWRQTTALSGMVTVDAMGNMISMDLDHEETVQARILDKDPRK
jgi:hypothetical protein